jgi:chemotaxis regulatin CheY-phosphate phosphatase CheZ
MNDRELSELIKKADELRALFLLGQRVIPFLEEIFLFVRDIEPLLKEINVSVEDNLKKMPGASKQLSKVTEATEMATTEIMDIVDGLVFKSTVISQNLEKIIEVDKAKREAPLKVLEIIQKAVAKKGDDKLLPQLDALIEKFKDDPNSEYQEAIDNTNELLNSIQMDASSIMMSLQVQDITSQQIAAVNHMLTTIQGKLGSILKKFSTTDLSNLTDEDGPKTNVSDLHRKIAFDPDAVDSISSKDHRQGEVDAILEDPNVLNGNYDEVENQQKIAEDPQPEEDEEISADDIDALFGGTGDAEEESTEEPAKEDATAEEESSGDDFEQISQDDIDAMFS